MTGRVKRGLSSSLSGILLALSWPDYGCPMLALVAFVPLLYVEQKVFERQKSESPLLVWKYAYISFFIWNIITTWWVLRSAFLGGLFVISCNAFLMSGLFYLYHLSRRILKPNHPYLIFPIYWIAGELLHLNWALSWPWLNIGNVFASAPKWVQWYEYTGALGGGFWILWVNVAIFRVILYLDHNRSNTKKWVTAAVWAFVLIIFPMGLSLRIYNQYKEEDNPLAVIIVQPNSDPYSVQFETPSKEAIKTIFALADSVIIAHKMDLKSDPFLILAPESAIQDERFFLNNNCRNIPVSYIFDHLRHYPNASLLTGASSFYIYSDDEKLPHTARQKQGDEYYYDAFNTAFLFKWGEEPQWYHKSKLTPGVEKMPFSQWVKPLERFALNLGGTVGTLGIDTSQHPLVVNGNIFVAPIICYESVYGAFCTQFVREGAELLCIVTNDGWWGESPGHRQHLQYASLRAIETRRSVARAANTGISAFFNQRGDVVLHSSYWEQTALLHHPNLNSKVTFYVKYGDYIPRIALVSALVLLITAFSLHLRKKTAYFLE